MRALSETQVLLREGCPITMRSLVKNLLVKKLQTEEYCRNGAESYKANLKAPNKVFESKIEDEAVNVLESSDMKADDMVATQAIISHPEQSFEAVVNEENRLLHDTKVTEAVTSNLNASQAFKVQPLKDLNVRLTSKMRIEYPRF